MAGLVLMVGVWMMSNPEVVMAVEGTFAQIASRLSKNREDASTRYEFEGDSILANEALNNPVEDPEWESAQQKVRSIGPVLGRLKEQEGRLYLMAGLEKIDITDQFSEEEPFTYVYTDSIGITHYVIIGGTFDPEYQWKQNIGWAEYFYDASLVGEDGSFEDGWIDGRAANYYDRETDEEYVWFRKGKEELNIPWP